MARRLGEYPLESGVNQQLLDLEVKQSKRHAESHRWHKLALLATAAGLVGAVAFQYLQETGFFGGADISQIDNQPRPTVVSPNTEAVMNLSTPLTPTEMFTATVESVESVIASLTPEFHFPGFIGPEFSGRTANRLRYPELWSVCQELQGDNGLPEKMLALGQALADKLPAGGDLYFCAGTYGQSWRAVDKDGIPLWNQAQDPADPDTEAGDYHWTLAPNDIPFDKANWRMESLSKVYQLKPGETWQRLTVDGDGGVMVEGVLDRKGNLGGFFDPRDGEFHEVEPPATGTPLPQALPTATPGGAVPTGEAAATATAPTPNNQVEQPPQADSPFAASVSECLQLEDWGYKWHCFTGGSRSTSIEATYPGMVVYVYKAVPGGTAEALATTDLNGLDNSSLVNPTYDYGVWDTGQIALVVMDWSADTVIPNKP